MLLSPKDTMRGATSARNAGAAGARKTDVGLFIKSRRREGTAGSANTTLRHVPMAALWMKLHRLQCPREGAKMAASEKAAALHGRIVLE